MTVREREMMILYEALEKQFCCFLPYAYSHLAAPFAYFIVACLHVCACTVFFSEPKYVHCPESGAYGLLVDPF